ncbi:MAG TPA: glycosyltransferase family 39 protein [Vicinamibacterales bacterium]|nr:glycosyltransferase family 39 protein [Vicinamibacterales bacterium]
MPAKVLTSRQTTGARAPRFRTIIPLALAAAFTGQCLWFIDTQSLTYDEGPHIIAGLDAWHHGRFELWNDQPPLGRLLLTAPIAFRSERWTLDNEGPSGANFWTIAIRPDPTRLAWQTRPVNVAIGLALMWLLWITTRRLLSEPAANVALALFACSPALIAHFSLATVDGIAVFFLFATAAAVDRWRRTPSWPATCGLGFVLAGLLLTKYSAPPLVALALVIMLVVSDEPRARFAKAGAALAIALTAVWAAFLFHLGPVTFRSGSLDGPYGRSGTVIVPLSHPFDRTIRLPAPEYIAALGGVAQHAVRGQPSFLLGEVRRSGGWTRYFPSVVLLKWPPTMWMMCGAAIAGLVVRRRRVPGGLVMMMLFPLVFFGLAMSTRLNVGDRYVLPVYPFLLLLGATLYETARSSRVGVATVAALIAIQAVDAARYAPDYLSYMTPVVAPERAYQWLSDSNIDWGQGLIALRDYQRAHPDQRLSLAYFGGVDPRSYGIGAHSFGEEERVHGTVVVSATHLSGQYLQNPTAYHWLLDYPRTTMLNHSLHVFEVP